MPNAFVRKAALNAVLVGLSALPLTAQINLVSTGANWKYSDDGSDWGTTWRSNAFDDAVWPSGASPLGYGNGDEATVVHSGPPGAYFITTYFRHRFEIADSAALTNLSIQLRRDDGAVVYLNGMEVFRSNMPEGEILSSSLAYLALSADERTNRYAASINPKLLTVGANIIAVEIHQQSASSPDMSFDLALIANFPETPPSVTIIHPIDQSIVWSDTLTMAADSSDADGAIDHVEFYADGVKLGDDFTQPHAFSWANLPRGGTVDLLAVAYDSFGLASTSATVHISVPPALVARGALWTYRDDGLDPPLNWVQPGFDDSQWLVGRAEFGFGDAGNATRLARTNSAGTTNLAFYFRHSLTVSDPAAYSNVIVRLLRDDGGIVYLNGVEVLRSNMPEGPVNSTTLAADRVDAPQESQFYARRIPPALLLPGTNVLAVEIHQVLPTSSDIGFDLELIQNVPPSPPLVTIEQPLQNAVFVAPANIGVLVSATDYDGPISQVQLVHPAAARVAETSEPYTFTLTGVSEGYHTLSAVAVDSDGLSSTSAPVHIEVLPPPIITTLVATGSVWKYLDDGSDPGTNWTIVDFDDAQWTLGRARFGMNEPTYPPLTTIRVGIAGGVTNITTYFRHSFAVSNAPSTTNLFFRVLRDDGVVAWLNGIEVFRMNMPLGPVSRITPAIAPVGSTNENHYFPTNINAEALINGTNVLAIELHQVAGLASWDASFDLSLNAGIRPQLPPFWLGMERDGADYRLVWTNVGCVLEWASSPDGTWREVSSVASPYKISATALARFYRLRRQ